MTTTVPARGSSLEVLLAISVPAAIAVAVFFSWVILINGLQIPYYLYYRMTIFLIYTGRDLDPVVWLASSAAAIVLVAIGSQRRSVSLLLSILSIWSGIALGALTILDIAGRQFATVGALATLAGCALAAFATTKATNRPAQQRFAAVLLLVLSLMVLPAEAGSLLYHVLSAFQPGIAVAKSWELLELQLWYTAFPLIPFLYAAFLFSWIWAPFVTKMTRKSMRPSDGVMISENISASHDKIWILATAGYILLAIFVGYYAYFHDPTYPLVGTDIYWRNALPAERVVSSASWLAAAARERHPLVVLGIAVVSSFLGLGVESLLRFAYVGLILAFGGAIFLMVLVGSGDRTLASFSALMATVSAPTAAGIYTGTVAEWVALIVWILSLALLAIKENRGLGGHALSTIGLGVGSVAVLFIHPWTWIAMMVGLIAYPFAAVMLRLKRVLHDVVSIMVVILFNGIALTLSLGVLSKTQGWRVAQAFSLIEKSLGSKYFGFGSWDIVVFFSQIWSQFLHPVLLVLSILGVVLLARRRDRFSAIVLTWLVAASITNMAAAPMGYNPLLPVRGETQIFRAMFLTAFQIPAAAGLLLVKSAVEVGLAKLPRSRSTRVVVAMVIGVVFLATLNGAFRALFPLLTDPHNYPNPLAP